jgi:hypothetical protein
MFTNPSDHSLFIMRKQIREDLSWSNQSETAYLNQPTNELRPEVKAWLASIINWNQRTNQRMTFISVGTSRPMSCILR